MPEITETTEYVNITPEWEPTCLYFARGLAEHAFERFAYGVVSSFMEQAVHLYQTDRPAFARVMAQLETLDARVTRVSMGKEE